MGKTDSGWLPSGPQLDHDLEETRGVSRGI
ncbi:UNVERIFIED_CONTAM: hypothetical protein GTU68_033121 [Idotea baltica]|nr:hypothetical protein [Idotea baltica]